MAPYMFCLLGRFQFSRQIIKSQKLHC